MQDFGITANRPIDVHHAEGAKYVKLEFRGLRDSPHVADKDTRIRINLPVERADELRVKLAAVLPPESPGQLEHITQLARTYIASIDAEVARLFPSDAPGRSDNRELAALRKALAELPKP